MKRGEDTPPCVPVSEVMTKFALDTKAANAAIDAPRRDPARHPWDEPCADALWDAEFVPAKPAEPPEVEPEVPDEDLIVGIPLPSEVTTEELLRALTDTSKSFLGGLGVFIPEDDPPVPGRESIEPKPGLGPWKIKDEILKELRGARGDVDTTAEALAQRALDRIAGRGDILLGAAARQSVADAATAVSAHWDEWRQATSPGAEFDQKVSVNITLETGAIEVRGVIERKGTDDSGVSTVESLTVSSPGGKHLLRAWLVQLVAAASSGATAARLYGLKDGATKKVSLKPIAETDARETLADLLSIWSQSRTRPIELFETMSQGIADGLDEDGRVSARARLEAEAAWFEGSSFGDEKKSPENEARWNAPFMRHFDPHDALKGNTSDEWDGLVGLADRVWGRLARATETEK